MTSNLAPLDGLRTGWAGALAAMPKAALPLIVAATVLATCLLTGLPGVWLAGTGNGAAAVDGVAGPGVPSAIAIEKPARARCETCGVLVNIRKIEPVGAQPAAFEFTVRLRDGTLQTRRDASAGNWRSGDRIMLLGGSTAPDAIHN